MDDNKSKDLITGRKGVPTETEKKKGLLSRLSKAQLKSNQLSMDKDKDKSVPTSSRVSKMSKHKDKDKAGLSHKHKVGKDKDKDKVRKGKKNPKWGKAEGKHMNTTARAGLMFSVGRVRRVLKSYLPAKTRSGLSTAVYAGAVLEYLTAEIIELAGNAAIKSKQKRITPRHLQVAIRSDDELNVLVKATLAGGGVMPKIEPALLTNAQAARQSRVPDKAGKTDKIGKLDKYSKDKS